ncbi:DNA circularization protein [Escherichia coli]|nr:DNA circularization protein [Escherichia coli]
MQRDVTTYRKNAYGVADNSYLDSETLHTSAYVLRKLKSVITSKYGRHKLASDGTRFGPGQAIVTPAVIKGELLATYRQLERAGIVENYELFKQYLVVERDASDPNRLNTLFPPDYVTEDLGKVTFRPSITAYVVGDDCFDQRDRLIEALNKPGPGTLVHPTYGELKVCVDGEVRVSTSKSEGRIVRFDLKFVEAGELSYPTSGAATAQTLMSSCSALDDCISDSFSGFSIDGVADFVQNDVIGNASIMLGYVSDAMKVVDSAVSDAARLLQGDISVLLPPPSSGKNFVEQVQKMWRTGKRLYGNASDLVTMIKTLSGISLGSDLQPRGVWKTDSKTTATATQQRNVVASTLRTTAISEAAYAITRLPAPTTSAVMQNSAVGQATTPAQSTGWPSVTHPALNNAPAVKNTVDLPTWEELTDIRDTLNTAIDKELSRTTSDALFLALRRVKADLNADINTRLEQSARIIQRTPDEVLPALVLAATWFDNAARDADIIRRNAITHPGFVPVIPLKVPVQ